jgi:hypothetical protein
MAMMGTTAAGRFLVPKYRDVEHVGSKKRNEEAFAGAVKNRAPLSANAFYPLPLGSIRPRGWLQRQLKIQADGLSGHLDETWPDVGPNSGWLGGTGESWERGPYFLDGLVPLAYLLQDSHLKEKAQKYIEWTLTNQAANGMIGPKSNDDWWPRIVMLKVLTQYYEVTNDPRVIALFEGYYAHQLQELPRRPLRDWGKFRWQDEVLSVIWLYNRNGDKRLLDLARLLHDQGFDWQGQYANFKFTQPITREFIKLGEGGDLQDLSLSTHGVNNGMAIKCSPVWSVLSGSAEDKRALSHQLEMLDEYHGLPNGMFSCDEHLAGRNPSQGSELCTVVETMFSLEWSLAILGNAELADRLERIAFNALPGAFTDDMWAHQYNQEPNQVECSLHHKPWTTDGPESNLFGLEPNFGCCTANYHQGWPKFTASLFMLSSDDGLAAMAYAPCVVRTVVRSIPVTLIEETEYPFRGSVRISVKPDARVVFPLQIRIPRWAAEATIKVNGELANSPIPGAFVRIERAWTSGDTLEIVFPLKPRVSRWFNDSIAVERGPLVFSYGIGEDWVKLRDRGMTADWQVYPSAQWNYAISATPDNVGDEILVRESEVGKTPFSAKPTAVELEVTARKLPDWHAEDGAADPVPVSPVASSEPDEKVRLVPYAAAKLRITAFPKLQG